MSTITDDLAPLEDPGQRRPAHLLQVVNGPIRRRSVLIGSLAVAVTAMGGRAVQGATKPMVSVHKSPS